MDDFVLGEPVDDDGGHALEVTVPAGLKTLDGHFPGNPIVPGVSQVFLVERAARKVWGDLGEPSAMVRLKFMQTLRPGNALRVVVRREKLADVRFQILREGVECSRGVLRFTG